MKMSKIVIGVLLMIGSSCVTAETWQALGNNVFYDIDSVIQLTNGHFSYLQRRELSHYYLLSKWEVDCVKGQNMVVYTARQHQDGKILGDLDWKEREFTPVMPHTGSEIVYKRLCK